jgi:sugar phosphate isomerase/epimerase
MISISCPKFSFIPLEKVLPEVSEHFDGFEIVVEEKHDVEHLIASRDLLKSFDLNISLHAPFNDINLASLRQEHSTFSRKEIEKVIRFASRADIEVITFHPGWPSPFSMMDEKRVKRIAKEGIAHLNSVAKECGVTACLENLPLPNFFSTPEELLECTDDICFDIGHANITGTLWKFPEKKKSIKNLHLHENRGKSDEHLALKGKYIDLKRLVKKLEGYKGPFVLEAKNLKDGVTGKKTLENFLDQN